MTLPMLRRLCGGLLVAAFAVPFAGSPAWAIDPPQVDPTLPPPSGAPGPVQPAEQHGQCVTAEMLPGTQPGGIGGPDLHAAWRFSHGEDQVVAIIDTGVRPGPRLPPVDPGGDYVTAGDGLSDCDGHGTLMAGVVAGLPGDDGFSGVAPASRLMSMRVASAAFSPRVGGDDPARARAEIDVAALSRAVVNAADRGARVIAIGSATCLAADRNVDQTALGAALRYAAVEKDALIVAAAGNTGQAGIGGGGTCDANPLTDPSRPDDPRNWAGVTTISAPSWWHPYVLSVGSLDPSGQPSAFTMAGPWLGVAAPGEAITSVSNRDDGGLANSLPGSQGRLAPLRDTGYAAAYVAGVAALVRSYYPQLTSAQAMHRIIATSRNAARAPSGLVGAGTVDPVAALTWELPPAGGGAEAPSKQLAAPAPPPAADPAPRLVAFAGTAALAALVAAVAARAAITARRRKDIHP